MGAFVKRFDWTLIIALVPILAWSLFTLKAVGGGTSDYFFTRQALWIAIGLAIMFAMGSVDWRLFANSGVIIVLYILLVFVLGLLLVGGSRVKGAASWFDLYVASFQPAEAVKLVLIFLLAKYFSSRHIDIARIRHIIISGLYTFVPVLLIFLQPDLGSAIIIVAIWLGMTLVAGIWLRHIVLLATLGIMVAGIGWVMVLAPYQKDRITTFLNPALDPQGAGYNAVQSIIAVGSGSILGKGVGFGSQSRLQFLPESETDFIFAAFVEEWGFVGATLLMVALGVFIWRVLAIGFSSPSNFTKLFAVGFSIMIMVQVTIHAGMNMGLLPITGITFPFLSYGGSNLVMLFLGVGILQNIYRERQMSPLSIATDITDAI